MDHEMMVETIHNTIVLCHDLFGTHVKNEGFLQHIFALTLSLLFAHLQSPEPAGSFGVSAERAFDHPHSLQPPVRGQQKWVETGQRDSKYHVGRVAVTYFFTRRLPPNHHEPILLFVDSWRAPKESNCWNWWPKYQQDLRTLGLTTQSSSLGDKFAVLKLVPKTMVYPEPSRTIFGVLQSRNTTL